MRTLIAVTLVFTSTLFAETPWQQDVHYTINARLDPQTHHILGSEQLAYKNNSPDVLETVYFRLYWNLFTSGSHGEEFALRNKYYYFDTTGGIWLSKFSIVDGDLEQTPESHLDNTLMEVKLLKPLHPGDSVVFRCEFDERVPEGGDRTGHQGRDYNIAQWYPQISVYDRYGWDKNQYLGGAEFHIDYGTFDVAVTLPRSFTLGYSGVLLNPLDVYPDSVRQRLTEAGRSDETVHIADYSNQQWGDADTAQVTWKFRAEHVRDFAWSANEHYIWDVAHWAPSAAEPAIAVHALYFRDKADFWNDASHMGRHAVSFFSTHYGLYAYPSMFVVEGVIGGGMEYPGIVFIGHYGSKTDHSLYGVIAHEIGHSWYPMMIGSNETYYAFMDEGFNTFITTTAVEDYYGRYDNAYEWPDGLGRLLKFQNDDERTGNQRQSLWLAKTGYEEPIATHSYRFEEQGLSGISIYPKTASVMLMLKYVLGDSVFEKVMKEYYNRWKFKLVYPEDFYATAQEVSGMRDLRWFFDEWFNRTSTCDYSIGRLKYSMQASGGATTYRTKIAVHKKGQAIMPVDVRVEMEDKNFQTVWIPYDRWINGEVEVDTIVDLPSRPVVAELNPGGEILDINRLNNTSSFPKVDFRLDNTIFDVTPIDAYLLRARPSVWYTDQGGWNLGYKLSGSYLDDLDAGTLYQMYNFRDKTVNYDLTLSNNMYRVSPLSSVIARSYRLEGRKGFLLGIQKGFREHYGFPPYHTLYVRYAYSEAYDPEYLLIPATWSRGNLQRMVFGYEYSNRGKIWRVNANATYEGSVSLFRSSDFVYSKRTVEMKGDVDMPADWTLSMRAYSGVGDGNIPNQTKYYFSMASPIEQFGSPFFRSKGPLPSTVRDHALLPGGAFMRGFYALPLAGDKAEALNADAKFSDLLPFVDLNLPLLSRISRMVHSSLFMDVGRLAVNPQNLWDQKFQVDWGFGLRLASLSSIFGQYSNSSLLSSVGLRTLKVDFPIYVSSPAPGENKIRFRWVAGLSESI